MRFLVLCALLALTYGQRDLYFRQPEKLLRNSNNVGDRLGEYAFAYETEGGILQSEMGSRKYEGTDSETQLIQGSVQYNDPNGEPVVFSYTADEYGTRVVGSHVPTPPPIPESIQRALKWVAQQPTTEEPDYDQKSVNVPTAKPNAARRQQFNNPLRPKRQLF